MRWWQRVGTVKRVSNLAIAERGRGAVRPLGARGAASWPRSQRSQLGSLTGLAVFALVVGLLVVGPFSGAGSRARQHTPSRGGLMSLPLAARGPVSAALGRDERSYRVLGLRARNPAQGLGMAFSRAGVTLATGKAR